MKADHVSLLDVGAVSPITEYFLLATGTQPRHVRALVEETERVLRDMGIRPVGREGAEGGTWAVLDYGPLVVHVFQPESRSLYDLDMLWGDGRKIRWRAPKPRATGGGPPPSPAPG